MGESSFGADDEDSVDAGAAEARWPRADEALRLVSSMQDWAQDWAHGRAERNVGEPGRGHGESSCMWCPLCQFAAVVRDGHPEVGERVTEAATAIAAAIRAVVDATLTAGSASAPREPPPSGERVQKITLRDEA